MKEWKIVVDATKAKEKGVTTIGFMKDGKLVNSKAFFDREEMTIYVEVPIEKPAVRERLIQYAHRC